VGRDGRQNIGFGFVVDQAEEAVGDFVVLHSGGLVGG
jgi:hypothetical protein